MDVPRCCYAHRRLACPFDTTYAGSDVRTATRYVGFWPRVGATIIDTILMLLICAPFVTFFYGREYWVNSEAMFIAGRLVVRSK